MNLKNGNLDIFNTLVLHAALTGEIYAPVERISLQDLKERYDDTVDDPDSDLLPAEDIFIFEPDDVYFFIPDGGTA